MYESQYNAGRDYLQSLLGKRRFSIIAIVNVIDIVNGLKQIFNQYGYQESDTSLLRRTTELILGYVTGEEFHDVYKLIYDTTDYPEEDIDLLYEVINDLLNTNLPGWENYKSENFEVISEGYINRVWIGFREMLPNFKKDCIPRSVASDIEFLNHHRTTMKLIFSTRVVLRMRLDENMVSQEHFNMLNNFNLSWQMLFEDVIRISNTLSKTIMFDYQVNEAIVAQYVVQDAYREFFHNSDFYNRMLTLESGHYADEICNNCIIDLIRLYTCIIADNYMQLIHCTNYAKLMSEQAGYKDGRLICVSVDWISNNDIVLGLECYGATY